MVDGCPGLCRAVREAWPGVLVQRCTKTQGSFRNEQSALTLLFGLIAMRQIRLRKIDGWRETHQFKEAVKRAA